MLENLCKDDADNKRDYIYYLAIAYTRIKDYQTAQNYVRAFLEIEPNNQQVMLLDVSSTKYLNNDDIQCIIIIRNILKKNWEKSSRRMQL